MIGRIHDLLHDQLSTRVNQTEGKMSKKSLSDQFCRAECGTMCSLNFNRWVSIRANRKNGLWVWERNSYFVFTRCFSWSYHIASASAVGYILLAFRKQWIAIQNMRQISGRLAFPLSDSFLAIVPREVLLKTLTKRLK